MGQQQSKDELLYQQVNYGNVQGILSLCRGGAGLEWIDREGKTPLILACMNPDHTDVAKTLISLGANIDAYRPGRNAGTPLHHAAKRGLEKIVRLLLSSGANALVMNDDCQTPLEVARAKGHIQVVRAIEGHICLFAGWLREFHGPTFLEVLSPHLVSKKVWVVVLPTGSRNPTIPFKLELAVYSNFQEAQPRTIVPLWKANMDESRFHQPDPSVTIIDLSTRKQVKLGPVSIEEHQQFLWFCNACKGIPQETRPPEFLHESHAPFSVPETGTQVQSSIADAPVTTHSTGNLKNGSSKETTTHVAGPVPSAPPITNDIMPDGLVHYPKVDPSPVDSSSSSTFTTFSTGTKEGGSVCVVCLDSPVEGVCVPCGHMAGCMACLREIENKDWGCPVCRTKINQVVRLYAV